MLQSPLVVLITIAVAATAQLQIAQQRFNSELALFLLVASETDFCNCQGFEAALPHVTLLVMNAAFPQ